MSPTSSGDPDLGGLVAAQRRLRNKLGRVVKFYTPTDAVYDPSLDPGVFDPDTGVPYDPTIQPISSGFVVASTRASVAFAPLATLRRDELQEQPEGIRSRLNKDLILDVNDSWVASAATMFELDGDFWAIVNRQFDGIGGKQRYIVYGQDTSADGADFDREATTGSNSND